MPPTPLDIEATRHSLSERYYLDNISNSDFPSPPADSPYTPGFPGSESECHLVISDSDEFKGREGGLPSFYRQANGTQSDLNPRVGEKPAKTRLSGTWRRHLEGWRIVIFDSWLNVLLIMIPVAWTIRLLMDDSYALVFTFCILALIPLVRLHDITVGQLALRMGGTKAGLLNASMSNFVEVVVAISALRKCELRVVQSSLVGSILSKLLLILGLCFFAGGMRFSEQGFDPTATQVHSSLLSISVGVLLLPAAYHFAISAGAGEAADLQKRDILKMSHGVAIVLVLIYLSYLAFQLWSHTHLYQDHLNKKSARLPVTQNISAEKAAAYLSARSKSTYQSCKSFADLDHIRSPSLGFIGSNSKARVSPPRKPYASSLRPGCGLRQSSSPTMYANSSTPIQNFHNRAATYDTAGLRLVDKPQQTIRLVNLNVNMKEVDALPRAGEHDPTGMCTSPTSSLTYAEFGDMGGSRGGHTGGGNPMSRATTTDSSESTGSPTGMEVEAKVKALKEPQISWFLTAVLMLSVTAAVAVTADWIVESMDGISTTISKEWVALILLPAVSSIAECITAVRVSVKDELSLSVSVAVGSTIQTALFVIPLMVLLGWITNKPLTLLIDPFESLVLYLSVQTTSYVLADGKSNWLEGFILVSLYLIIAVSFWFYPGSTPLDFLASVICPRK